jgi:hypothetical protein
MLFTVGGNLDVEPTPQGIKAEISALRYIDSAFFGLVFLIGAPFQLIDRQGGGPGGAGFVACVGLALLIYATKGGSTSVSLSADEMTIVRRRFGIDWSTRVFPTSTVRNLSYLPPTDPPWFSRSRGLPGEICFDSGKKTYRFGTGIGYDDAKELIRQMTRVYKFPWDLPEKR